MFDEKFNKVQYILISDIKEKLNNFCSTPGKKEED